MVSIIVAVSLNGVIGVSTTIPWRIADDMKIFREKTLNRTVVMGRKTFESIGKPLPNRKNIIISSTAKNIPGVQIYKTPDDIPLNEETYIIGGAEIYRYFLPRAKKIYYSLIDVTIAESPDNTLFTFKPWKNNEWQKVSEQKFSANEKNQYSFTFMEFHKK